MTTVTAEQIHTYPKRLRWIIEIVSAIAVTLSTFLTGREVLRYFWNTHDIDDTFEDRFPLLYDIVDWLDVQRIDELRQATQMIGLIPDLFLLALALLITLLLRNAFPTIRTSGRGMLVEFAGSWLPIGWEDVAGVKATESPAGRRYVLLVQTRHKRLTGWHRFYSFIYRFTWRRGFFITSSIQSFDELVKTILHEADRTARVMDVTPARLDESAISPHFQFLLSPIGFFSRRPVQEQPAATVVEQAPEPAPAAVEQGVVEASYPWRIKRLFNIVTFVLVALAVLRYLGFWRRFIGGIWSDGPAFFRQASEQAAGSPLWQLIAGHLMLLLLAPVLIIIWSILPDLRARPDGLAVRFLQNWILIPWQRVTRIDAAELSQQNHVLLIETTPATLRASHRAASLLFAGRFSPGVLVTSAISNFEPLLQRALLAVSRTQPANPDEPIFNDNAPAWGIRLLLSPSSTIDRLVAEAREDDSTQTIDLERAKGMLGIPMLLAALPALILLGTLFIDKGLPPTAGRIGVVIALFIWGMIEWPLVATLASVVEARPDIDAEQARPYYLYPIVQIPRLLPLMLAYALTLLSIPVLPTLLWIGAAVWSFLLTAGLWQEMYDWHGAQLLMMGLVPALFQILTLVAYGVLIP